MKVYERIVRKVLEHNRLNAYRPTRLYISAESLDALRMEAEWAVKYQAVPTPLTTFEGMAVFIVSNDMNHLEVA